MHISGGRSLLPGLTKSSLGMCTRISGDGASRDQNNFSTKVKNILSACPPKIPESDTFLLLKLLSKGSK